MRGGETMTRQQYLQLLHNISNTLDVAIGMLQDDNYHNPTQTERTVIAILQDVIDRDLKDNSL